MWRGALQVRVAWISESPRAVKLFNCTARYGAGSGRLALSLCRSSRLNRLPIYGS